MVLFITGQCPRSCWYCPLSRERRGFDRVYANEKEITSPAGAVEVARMMAARGTGVTGGEPLVVLQRVIEYCRKLKEAFGDSYHIHLYTGTAPGESDLYALRGYVDEIRLHPPHGEWENFPESAYGRAAVAARRMGFAVGVEVPSLPGLPVLKRALPLLDFLNINELEWGETNAQAMRERSLSFADGMHNAVEGAADWAGTLTRDPKVHWCSSCFKDSVQLRRRLIRTAVHTARPFEEVTPDGTIIYGVAEVDPSGIPALSDLPEGTWEAVDGKTEMAWWSLRDLSPGLSCRQYIIERYPDRGIIVEVTPLK